MSGRKGSRRVGRFGAVAVGLALLMVSGASASVSAKQESEFLIRDVPVEEKVIALTFDDGPTTDETVQILDLLQRFGVRATFFVLGFRVERYPDIVRREVAEGHELANHTYSHMLCTPSVSNGQLIGDIRKAQKAIEQVTGVSPRLYRPVQGFYNDRLLQGVHEAGLQTILWSRDQDTWDWDRPGVGRIVRTVLNNASGGDIVLMHDHVHGKSDTLKALEIIVPRLLEQGFRFVTVSELLEMRRATVK
ncbi:polysaccharide deacetylase family protein [Paenibacillus koleovorans]|uniref:polysaccharide deacetylase family protein n=1 Tax=Paenibacillus koleovorans TaxID=121608 RepID=UPI000FD8A549|nr:polysaccharide deacetylase family protein [Paenibacillus koleovorans]